MDFGKIRWGKGIDIDLVAPVEQPSNLVENEGLRADGEVVQDEGDPHLLAGPPGRVSR